MNINYYNPTRVIFQPGALQQLGQVVSQYGKKALVVTGGGSVKRNGTFDRVAEQLKSADVDLVDFNGVEPNPRISTVRRAAQVARDEGCDVIIALGGGSTMDASKVIAAAFYYDGDPWDMIYHGQAQPYVPTKALPIITVPTLAASGSEMNMGAVISNEETQQKSFIQNECLFPKVAVVDPELTKSVPQDQTAYGVFDLITHVTEAYFNGMDGTPIQDHFAESIIKTAMEFGPRAIADGDDLEARSQIQWASILALNGWVNAGTNGGYPVHMIEHTLSAYHDITHAAGLAVINHSWMRYAARHDPKKFVRFAENTFGLKAKSLDDLDCALEGIDKFEAFTKSLGCPTRLSEVGINDSKLEVYAKDTLAIIHDQDGKLPARPPMSESDIVEMLKAVL